MRLDRYGRGEGARQTVHASRRNRRGPRRTRTEDQQASSTTPPRPGPLGGTAGAHRQLTSRLPISESTHALEEARLTPC